MTSKRENLRTQLLSAAAAKFGELNQETREQLPYTTNSKLIVERKADSTTIRLTKDLYLPDLIRWNEALWREAGASVIDFDFSYTKFFTPLSLLFIPHQIRKFHRQYPEIRLHAIGYQHLSYPAHMGFFDCFGGAYGKTVGEAPGDRNYLPISSINVSQFIKDNGTGNIQEAIDSETKRLARVLVRANDGFAFDAVQYSLREIIRNVFEHSGSRICMYCAQYWPATKKVQLCIVDEGSGIHSSLTFNPKFKDFTERQAVQFSLFPGVSGNFREMRTGEVDSRWRNSGYGLYMTSRLCRNNGGFRIFSSGQVVQLIKGQKLTNAIRNFRGTMITMDLLIGSQSNFSKELENYATEGKKIARDIQGANVIEASAASQLLSRDFAKQ